MDHTEFVEMVRTAADLGARWKPKHPQHIDNAFYLTQAQFDAVIEAFPRPHEPDRLYTQAIWGIPVHIIKPGDQIVGKDGKVLVFSPAGELYAWDSPVLSKKFPPGDLF